MSSLLVANSSYTVNITARVTDNGVLRVAEISLGEVPGTYSDMEKDADTVNRYDFLENGENLTGTRLFFYIHAVDEHGNEFTFVPTSGIPFA